MNVEQPAPQLSPLEARILGALIEKISSRFGKSRSAENCFEKSLLVGLILMMALTMYIIFDVIIYRYYL